MQHLRTCHGVAKQGIWGIWEICEFVIFIRKKMHWLFICHTRSKWNMIQLIEGGKLFVRPMSSWEWRNTCNDSAGLRDIFRSHILESQVFDCMIHSRHELIDVLDFNWITVAIQETKDMVFAELVQNLLVI